MNEIERRFDRIEKKIDIILENSGQVKSHINWVDRIAKMFMPTLTRLITFPRITNRGAEGDLRGNACDNQSSGDLRLPRRGDE